MAQWAPWPRSQATFQRVFPYGVMVGDEILLGSTRPIAFDRQVILQRLQDPWTNDYLARGRVDPTSIRDIIENYPISFWSPDRRQDGDINTDLFPRDEYYLNN